MQAWYTSTSNAQERRSYRLNPDEVVHVSVSSIVQETALEFDRRAGQHDRILSEAAHLQIMRHNFSNVVT